MDGWILKDPTLARRLHTSSSSVSYETAPPSTCCTHLKSQLVSGVVGVCLFVRVRLGNIERKITVEGEMEGDETNHELAPLVSSVEQKEQA